MNEAQRQWVANYRTQNPDTFHRALQDDDAFKILQQRGEVPDEYKDEEFEKYLTGIDPDKHKPVRTRKSGDFNFVSKMFMNFEDLIPDYRLAQAAYEKSVMGRASEIHFGSKPFNVDVEELGAKEDLLSTIASFYMPLDHLLLGVGGKIGHMRNVGGKVYFRSAGRVNRLLGKMDDVTRAKGIWGLPKSERLRMQASMGGWHLAPYEAALGYIEALHNGDNPILGAVVGAGRGAVLGAGVGMTSWGMQGRKAKLLNRGKGATTPEKVLNMKWGDKAEWAGLTAPFQVAMESAVFTLGGAVYDDTIVDSIFKGRDRRSRDLIQEWIDGSLLFMTQRPIKRILAKGKPTLEQTRDTWIIRAAEKVKDSVIKNTEGNISERIADMRKQSEVLNHALEELRKAGTVEAEKLESLQDNIDKIAPEWNRLQKLLESKGAKAFKEDVGNMADLYSIKDMLSEITSDMKDIKGSDIFEPNSKDAVEYERTKKQLENLDAEMDSVLDAYGQDFVKYYEGKQKATGTIRQAKALGINKIYSSEKQREVDLFDSEGKLNVKIEDVEAQVKTELEIRKGDASKTVEEKLEVESKDEFKADRPYEKKTQKDRRNLISKILTKDKDSPYAKGSKEDIAFKESSRYIDYMLQKVLLTEKQKGGRSLAKKGTTKTLPIGMTTVKMYKKGAVALARFLADRGLSFKDLTQPLLEEFGASGKHSGASPFINLMLTKLRRLEDKKGDLLNPDFSSMSDTQVKAALEKKASPSEVEFGQTARVGQKVTMKIKGVVTGIIKKFTGKAAVFKGTPISKRLNTLLDGLAKKVVDKWGSKKIEDVKGEAQHYFYSEGKNEGKEYDADVNAKVEYIFGSKIKGGKKHSATQLRHSFAVFIAEKFPDSWGVVDMLGLGHGLQKAELEALGIKSNKDWKKETYGKNETALLTEYKRLIDEFYKEINKQGKTEKEIQKKLDEAIKNGEIDPEKYHMLEIALGLKKIEGMKDGSPLTLKVPGLWNMERTYSKENVEAMMRYLLEVPSRIGEIVSKKKDDYTGWSLTKKEFKREIGELTTRDLKQERQEEYNDMRQAKQDAGEFKNKSASEIREIMREAMNKQLQLEERAKEREVANIEKAELDLNREIHGIENMLDLKGDFTKKDRNDLRRSVFGSPSFKIGEVSRAKLEVYRDLLNEKLLKKTKEGNKALDDFLDKHYISDELAENFALAIDKRSGGDIHNLTPEGRRVFKFYVEKHSKANEFNWSEPGDKGSGSGPVDILADKLPTTRRKSLHGWVMMRRLANKATGHLKTAATKIQQWTVDIVPIFEFHQGRGNLFVSDIRKSINKSLGRIADKNGTWQDYALMADVIKGLKHKDPEIRKKYIEEFELVGEWYENSKIDGTKENLIMKEVDGAMKDSWTHFEGLVLKAIEPLRTGNAKERRLFRQQLKELKALKEEGYRPHFFTAEGKEIIRFTDGFKKEYMRVVEELLDKKAEEIVDKKIESKFKKLQDKKSKEVGYKEAFDKVKKSLKNNVDEYSKIQRAADAKAFDSFQHGKLEVNSKNFMNRAPNQIPLFQKNQEGKIVRMFETNISDNLSHYFLGTAKFLSVLETAPEYTKWGQRGGGLMSAYEAVNNFYRRNKDEASVSYMEEIRHELMGTKDSQAWKWLGNVSNAVATIGLSGITTPGLKNAIMSHIQLFTTMPTDVYIRGVLRSLKWTPAGGFEIRKMWKAMQEAGAGGYVAREFLAPDNASWAKKTFGKAQRMVYISNFLTLTENFGRALGIEMTKIQLNQITELYHHFTVSDTTRRDMRNWLSDTLRFTEKDIAQFTSKDILKPENAKILQKLVDKGVVYGHKATHGGVGILDAPTWMSRANLKHMFLFQRIAASVGGNQIMQTIKPLRYGNFAPMIKLMSGGVLGGWLLYEYEKLLWGGVMPEDMGNWLDKAITYMWRAELANVFGSAIDLLPVGWNPYYEGTTSMSVQRGLEPAIAKVARNAIGATLDLVGKKLTPEQWIKDVMTQNVVGMNQLDKAYKYWAKGDKEQRIQYQNFQKVYNWNRQYRRENGTFKPYNEWPKSKRTPYYRDLKNMLWFGTKEEIEQAFWTAHGYVVDDMMDKDKTLQRGQAQRDAYNAIKASVAQMSPMKINDKEKKGHTGKENTIYLLWVEKAGGKEAVDLVRESDRHFKKMYNTLGDIYNDLDSRAKYSRHAPVPNSYWDNR